MNVALTRARHLLIIFGKSETLNNDDKWKMMIDQVKQVNCNVNLLKEDLVKDDT